MQKSVVILFVLWYCSVSSRAQLYQSLRFEPSTVDFGAWAIGTVKSQSVTIINQSSNRSVYLSSVSGKTADFYSSFFESKVVPPMGNTTFSVVFLPRGNGAVAADLLIHTSFGQASFLVRGEGLECPYRLKPIVGIRAPLNSTLSPEIHMYNPHERPLQILEVYSSGGQFQLELPSGGHEGPQVLWEIPPHTTKPVIRIKFHGQNVGNYTAYIRIKISERHGNDATSSKENMLVVPVEFQILSDYGLYTESPILDFGRTTTESKPIKLQLQLQSSHNKRQFELDTALLSQHWQDVPGLSFNTSDSTVSLNPQLFRSNFRLDKMFTLHSNEIRHNNDSFSNSQTSVAFSIIIRANVFKGTLGYNQNTTIFVTQSTVYERGEKRKFTVRNNFDMPLLLLKINLQNESVNALQIQTIEATQGAIIPPGSSLNILELSVLNDSVSLETSFSIYTNVTNFFVPVIICTGRLHIYTNDSRTLASNAAYHLELDLGVIPHEKMSHFGYIVMYNQNPIAIKITTWDFQSDQDVYFHTTFLGCLRPSTLRAFQSGTGNVSINNAKFKFCSHLQAGDVAVIEVAIQSYKVDKRKGSLKIWTPYEEINVNVKFHTWLGKLEVVQEHVYFNNCFPGKMCTAQLAIRSSFKHNITVRSVHFDADGLRFEDFNPKGSVILPEMVSTIGRIYLEPAQLCHQRCYIPQEEFTHLQAFPPPEKTRGGANNNLHFDEAELRRRTELYRQLKWYYQTISFTLNSHEVRQLQLQLTIDLEWPKLVAGVQTLPTIEVGNSQQLTVTITNPSNSAILIDYFLADPKYAKDTQLSLPLEVIDASSNCYLTDKSTFSLPNGSPNTPILLPAHKNVTVPVIFKAFDADSYCTLLHIRNNLTLYEAVWLTAKSVQSQFRFGNRKPGSTTPLFFELSEKLMSVCEHHRSQDKPLEPIISVKRSFTARNTGEISIRVDGFSIGDQPCEGYGFKVIDCPSFDLKANASKKIEIVFNPDFTSTRVSRPLILFSNLSYEIKYMLLAQLSSINLDKCAELQSRPIWETRIRKAAIVLLATTFIFVLIAAHIDYGNILVNQSALYAAREKGPIHHFNLRNIVAAKDNAKTVFDDQLEQRISPTNKTSSAVENTNSNCVNDNGHQTKAIHTPQGNNSSYSGNQTFRKRGSTKQQKHMLQQQPLADESWTLQLSTALKDANSSIMTSECSSVKLTQFSNERGTKLKSESSGSNSSSTPTSESSLNPTNVNGNCSSSKIVPLKLTQVSQTKEPVTNATNNSNSTSTVGKKKQRELKKNKYIATNEKVTIQAATNKNSARTSKLGDKMSIVNEDYSSLPSSTNNAEGMNIVNDILKMKPITPVSSTSENKEVNGAIKKVGKTPGRERNKKDTLTHNNCGGTNDARLNSMLCSSSSSSSCSSSSINSKGKERKQKGKSVCALNFQGIPHTNDVHQNMGAFPITATSQWDALNQVSFSKILQQPENPSRLASNYNGSGVLDMNGHVGQFLHGFDTNTSRQQHQANEMNFSTELGPIGSKKSPCSTPSVWDSPIPSESPVLNATESAQQLQQTLTSNNSSFFSNMLHNNFNTNDFIEHQQQQPQQYMNIPLANPGVNLYEMEYLINLRQQHLLAQQQQLLQCNDNNALNWNSGTAWSPMNYEHSSSGMNALNGYAPLQGGWQQPLNGTIGNNNASTGIMRPPPGLEGSIPGIGHNHLQATGHNSPGMDGQTEPNMQTFDPFSSLSSIWNDNWHKQQQNSHGNNN